MSVGGVHRRRVGCIRHGVVSNVGRPPSQVRVAVAAVCEGTSRRNPAEGEDVCVWSGKMGGGPRTVSAELGPGGRPGSRRRSTPRSRTAASGSSGRSAGVAGRARQRHPAGASWGFERPDGRVPGGRRAGRRRVWCRSGGLSWPRILSGCPRRRVTPCDPSRGVLPPRGFPYILGGPAVSRRAHGPSGDGFLSGGGTDTRWRSYRTGVSLSCRSGTRGTMSANHSRTRT